MNIKNILGTLGASAIGIGALFIFLLILTFLVKGISWISEIIYPYLVLTFGAVFWISICIFLPLAFIRKTRTISGYGFLFSGWIGGIILWVNSLLTIHDFWGWVGVLFGFIFAFIGMIPLAIIASILHADWSALRDLLTMTAFSIISIILGFWMFTRVDKDNSRVIDEEKF